MAWDNTPLIVYHGTNTTSAEAILRGIDLTVCRPIDVDFGPGFYVTTLLTEALHWAVVRSRLVGGQPAVVAFDLDRDAVAKLGDHLTFTLPSADFFDFVEYNRYGHPHHARRGDPSNDPPIPPRHYDLVYGPVSRFPERMPMPGWDQICCLSENAVRCLTGGRLESLGAS